MAPHSSILPGKSHGWRTLVGYSPWGRKESDTTEWLSTHTNIDERNWKAVCGQISLSTFLVNWVMHWICEFMLPPLNIYCVQEPCWKLLVPYLCLPPTNLCARNYNEPSLSGGDTEAQSSWDSLTSQNWGTGALLGSHTGPHCFHHCTSSWLNKDCDFK